MWTGFTSIFSFPQGSCSFPPIVLLLELHTPVCEKPCLRKLQLLSWQLSLEPPESNFPPQCQSCACVLALGVAPVCNSTTYTDLPQRAGLGLSATYGLDSSYASFGGALYYWLSSVMLVRNLECCQTSAWGLGHGNSGISRSQNSMVLKWFGCMDLGDAKTELGSGSILERNSLVLSSTDKELNFLKYHLFNFVRIGLILSFLSLLETWWSLALLLFLLQYSCATSS